MAGEGRTVVAFKCPCSDAVSTPPSPAPRVSYWVEAEAPGGFPVILQGEAFRLPVVKNMWPLPDFLKQLLRKRFIMFAQWGVSKSKRQKIHEAM